MPISVRISDLDSCQQSPTHLDQLQQVPKVPVIRIYGALKASSGNLYNVLVHVHNYYPYLFIDCPVREQRRVDEKYLVDLAQYLDGCLAESFSRKKDAPDEEESGSSNEDLDQDIANEDDNLQDSNIASILNLNFKSHLTENSNDDPTNHGSLGFGYNSPPLSRNTKNTHNTATCQNNATSDGLDSPELSKKLHYRFIAAVLCCRACPVYGYTVGYSLKLKILLLLPRYKTRLFGLLTENKIDLLSFSDAPVLVNGKKSMPVPNIYEAHINYYSQFLADFNLYGCGWLEISDFYFRQPIMDQDPDRLSLLKVDLMPLLASNNVLNPKTYPRMSRSLLEIDIHVGSILNRSRVRQKDVHNDFTEFATPIPQQDIYLTSLRLTLDELKFQCESRGRNDTSQILFDLYSQVFTKLGQRGYSQWEFSTEHKHLLNYVTKLNNPAPYLKSPLSYYDKKIRPLLPLADIPTPFELVTQTTEMDFYGNVAKVNFRDDLIRWSSVDSIVQLATTGETNAMALVSSPVQSDEENEPEKDILEEKTDSIVGDIIKNDSHKTTTFNVSPLVIPSSPIDISSSPIIPSSPTANDVCVSADSSTENNSLVKDLDIYNQTQRGQLQPYVESLLETTSSISQTTNYVVRNPKQVFEFAMNPRLSKARFIELFETSEIMEHDYHDPAYFNKNDVHSRPLVYANKKITVPLRSELELPQFDSNSFKLHHTPRRKTLTTGDQATWQYSIPAPKRNEITIWIESHLQRLKYKRQKFQTQIEPAVTQSYDFKDSHENARVTRETTDFPNLTQMHMELHASTANEKNPNPAFDEITMIIFHFDDSNRSFNIGNPIRVILISLAGISGKFQTDASSNRLAVFSGCDVLYCSSERSMVERFCSLVDYYDPDILSGYEVNSSSWGFLCERFQKAYKINMMARLSRVVFKGNGKFGDRWGYTHTSAIKINGRHMLNIWRLLRLEVSLTSYSLENVCLHILHHTLPRVSNWVLSQWLISERFSNLNMVCNYFKQRIDVIMQIIDVKELVLKNVELSRLIGIDFYSNFYRGSQFKVESILIRIAKPENLLLNSPSKTQVHNMRALEVIPLILEPDSAFYKSPLVVLDFQSLYPSIMIAYNYCYSTLLGKMEGFKMSRNPIGYMKHHNLPHGLLEMLGHHDGINISPNGLMFVSSKFRKSILSRMLQEILNMRINVKTVASTFSNEKELQKLLNSKQLALKLIANVTYGYTSASFSGRMPSSDIADAIVATGREVMQKAIDMIESSGHNAKVVYGDTDSIFVYFPGKSKDDAFKYGRELAQSVTDIFPDPIKLKFEKVYHPCVLLAKKRYVGNCFEHEAQKVPSFEAKGIETIRRDGVPAQLKMVGKSLRILFETKNLSTVKSYIVEQFYKILQNRVNVSDYCFAKEVRHGTYKNEKYLPPGAVIAQKLVKSDPRKEPQYRERVPYVVIRDVTKERIKDRSRTPEEYVQSFETSLPMELDHEYYITRVLIPPLERIFNLMGVNIREWYRDMPRNTKSTVVKKNDILFVGEKILRRECIGCGQMLARGKKWLCDGCETSKTAIVADLAWLKKSEERRLCELMATCENCCFKNFSCLLILLDCQNHDCRIYYSRMKAQKNFSQTLGSAKILDEVIDEKI